jgi:hypothetical protein
MLICPTIAQTKVHSRMQNPCYRWQTQVDPSLKRVVIDNSTLTDAETQEGIGCLLSLKGRTKIARFTGATRGNYNSSTQYKAPDNRATIEIAALYYISFLFYKNWQHADSISLFDEGSEKINSNTKVSVRKAYKSYEEWFEKLKVIGVNEARKKKFDPLAGSGISWN